ncbi:MAG: DUF4160 domain-containing protein [Anaerolineae bacterium]|nr:DUF4160 domain-containing protein [Anaerolineae bacterium]
MTPRILTVGGFRFIIFTHDHPPAHVHVLSGERRAKFGLNPVRLLSNRGYHSRELKQIERLVVENQKLFLNIWGTIYGDTE